MSDLPLAQHAVVPGSKVQSYLLAPDHPRNGGKAKFFTAFGFAASNPAPFAAALRTHPIENAVVSVSGSPYGMKFIVRCALRTPDQRDPCITTVWIAETGAYPRLVTAYPSS